MQRKNNIRREQLPQSLVPSCESYLQSTRTHLTYVRSSIFRRVRSTSGDSLSNHRNKLHTLFICTFDTFVNFRSIGVAHGINKYRNTLRHFSYLPYWLYSNRKAILFEDKLILIILFLHRSFTNKWCSGGVRSGAAGVQNRCSACVSSIK